MLARVLPLVFGIRDSISERAPALVLGSQAVAGLRVGAARMPKADARRGIDVQGSTYEDARLAD
eukprot:159026-Chlamydomonas_euryale.AAC.2